MSQTLPAGLPIDSQNDGARRFVDQRREVLGALASGEARLDPVAAQRMGEQGVGRAVQRRRRDDRAAAVGERQEGVGERGLAGGDGERARAAFEQRDALLEDLGRRIGDAAVAEAFGFEIEQRGAMIGAVELIGDGLVDRRRDRLGRRIAIETAVN